MQQLALGHYLALQKSQQLEEKLGGPSRPEKVVGAMAAARGFTNIQISKFLNRKTYV